MSALRVDIGIARVTSATRIPRTHGSRPTEIVALRAFSEAAFETRPADHGLNGGTDLID